MSVSQDKNLYMEPLLVPKTHDKINHRPSEGTYYYYSAIETQYWTNSWPIAILIDKYTSQTASEILSLLCFVLISCAISSQIKFQHGGREVGKSSHPQMRNYWQLLKAQIGLNLFFVCLFLFLLVQFKMRAKFGWSWKAVSRLRIQKKSSQRFTKIWLIFKCRTHI